MKKVLMIFALAALTLTSCENKEQKERLENAEALAAATREELQQAVTERDELLDLINEVSSGMDEIKSVEGIVAVNASGEVTGNRSKVSSDIAAIRATLDERRRKVEELEKRFKDSKLNNSKLQATIQTLKNQIDMQAQEIESLTVSLSAAKTRIAQLDTAVDSLNTTVTAVSNERDQAEAEAIRQANIANSCYVAVGSKSELKKYNIIEGGGFLRKSKIMQGDFDKSFFVTYDKRTLTSIPLYSKKAKIISSTPPAGSYEMVKDANGLLSLKILNPSQFWGISNYLVVQVD